MGRSVSTLTNAKLTYYFDVSRFGMTAPFSDELDDYDYEAEKVYCQMTAEMDWDEFESSLTNLLQGEIGSLRNVDRWDGREVRIVLANQHIEFGIAEYFGIASLSIRIHEHDFTNHGLAEHHLNQVRARIERVVDATGLAINRVGGFSDGTSIYERKTA